MCQNTICRHTAVVITDPYNDFLHPNGKLYGLLADSLKEKDTIAHIKELLTAARAHSIPVYYGMHQQYKPGSYQGWKHMAKIHESQADSHVFEEGSWGAEFFEGLEPKLENGDVVVSKHWNSSGFQSTDLDAQLHQRDITNLVFCGLTANACMEATARYGYELGYHVTMMTDATAGFTKEATDAATDLVWPLFAHEVMTVGQYLATYKDTKK